MHVLWRDDLHTLEVPCMHMDAAAVQIVQYRTQHHRHAALACDPCASPVGRRACGAAVMSAVSYADVGPEVHTAASILQAESASYWPASMLTANAVTMHAPQPATTGAAAG
jgi:hypothetical protein